MRKLPAIFDKVRFSIPADKRPKVVLTAGHGIYDLVDAEIREGYQKNPGGSFHFNLNFWENFWIESATCIENKPRAYAVHCYGPPGSENLDEFSVTIWNARAEHRGTFKFGDYWIGHVRDVNMPRASDDEYAYEGLAGAIAFHLHYFSKRLRETVNVPASVHVTDKSVGMSTYVKVGDTLRYERVNYDEVRKLYMRTVPQAHEPAYHKRQHDVVGHWRQYKSGKRVYVRAHTRGDPKLGVITKIYAAP